MRPRLLCVVLMLLLVPTASWASDHVASLFGSLSFLAKKGVKGGQLGLEVSAPTDSKIHDHVGILVDASVHGGSDGSIPTTKAVLLVGIRGLLRVRENGPLVLFAHGLIGGHRSHLGGIVDNGWAGGAGAGFDILIGNTAYSGWAFRNQYDWVKVAGENSLRAAFGFAYRFKEAPTP
jgi:hypothetical protein